MSLPVNKFLTFAVLSLVLAGCKPPEQSNLKAIVGAVLIDGSGGPPVSDSVVLVAGSRIRAAGSRPNVPIPAAAEKVNGAGKFVVPGLVDVHVHIGRRPGLQFDTTEPTRDRIEEDLKSYLYYGVTAVRSMGADGDPAFEVRNAQRGGELAGARLFTAGRGFAAPGATAAAMALHQPATPEEARRQVSELAARRPDAIKIWVDDQGGRTQKLEPAITEAILDEARKHHIPVTAHIQSLADARRLVDSGISGFLHMIRDTGAIGQAFIDRLRNLQVVFAPALVREELGSLYRRQPSRLDDPDLRRTVDPAIVAAARSAPEAPPPAHFEIVKRNTRALAAGGVPIAVGSDGGSPLDFPGLGTHRELELLVESGLSPVEVIQAATRHGALALRQLDELGGLQPGKRADLLLLSANPTEDIRNLRRIDRIMLNGEWIDRNRLKLR
jgi:imidazolonepropionase-like amidohydrolase